VCFVDMLKSCGAFSLDEVEDLLSFGCLNGLFVLGRSIGFMGHYIDQLRLKQPLYRHPWDDITYIGALAGEEEATKGMVSLGTADSKAGASGRGSGAGGSGSGSTDGARGPCHRGACRVVRDTCTVA